MLSFKYYNMVSKSVLLDSTPVPIPQHQEQYMPSDINRFAAINIDTKGAH